MTQYMIHCSQGSGGLFLTSMFALALGLDVQANFSTSGHAHDMGRGNWKGADSVCLIGDHWKENYRPNVQLYYTHVLPNEFQNPAVKIIKIVADPDDYKKVAELYVCKAWPDLWTKEEYSKWASDQYPPYSADNIPNSKLVVDDLVNDLQHSIVGRWHQKYQHSRADFIIDFKTVMGLDNNDLARIVCDIVQCSVNANVKQLVEQYQQLNKSLYFGEHQ